jgi:DNA polymerase III delta subunit
MAVPSVVLVSGAQALLRNRYVRKYIEQTEAAGVRIDYVNAENPGALSMAVSGSPFLSGKALAVIENPHKGDLDVYRDHAKVKKPETILMLVYDGDPKGNTKFGKFAKGLDAHMRFSAPNQWKAPEAAVDFAVQEAEEVHGKTLTRELAWALVGRIGNEFGVVVFEIQKMAILATVDGSDVIETRHVKEGMAELADASVGPLFKALQARSKPHIIKALNRLEDRSRSDPTMMVCRMLGAEAMKWLQAVSLKHMPPKAAADELGLHPWYFENKILPVARHWGVARITRLLRALAASERGVLNGHISPWNGLKVNLLLAC